MTSPNASLAVLVLLASIAAPALAPRPATAGPAAGPALPTELTVPCGTVIAHGNELQPPFSLALDGDTLVVEDARGRRLASPLPAAGSQPGGAGRAVRLAQLAHLLARGGLFAFGSSYALAFPPARATEVLSHLHWVMDGASHLGAFLPQDDPLLRDLLQPARLADPPDGADTANEQALSGEMSS